MRPAYRALHASGEITRRAHALLDRLSRCQLCPRRCGADRLAGGLGECGVGRFARVSSAFAHFGEEAVLVGTGGSGTIFFSECNLRCVFCQNWEISHGGEGREVEDEDLASLMLDLQDRGCHNVNLVTPSHVVPQVVAALANAVSRGLRVPIVFNTSAYDTVETLRVLDGLVDIYMPDFKYWTPEASAKYLTAPDYPEVAREAIREMHRQVGDLQVGRDGVAVRGLLVRHLVMPGALPESFEIIRFLASLSRGTHLNVMAQYRPLGHAGAFPEIARRPLRDEVEAVRRAAIAAGLTLL